MLTYVYGCKCLTTTDTVDKAVAAGTLNESNADFFEEVADWKKLQQHGLSGFCAQSGSDSGEGLGFITISSLAGAQYRFPLTPNSTTKDVKLFMGAQLKREPRSIRLLHSGKDVKVSELICLPLWCCE